MSTLVFACGAECGDVATGAVPGAGGVQHWDIVTGAVTIDTATVRSGLRSYKFTSAAGTQIAIRKNIAGAPTIASARFYLRFSALPTADCTIAVFTIAANAWTFIYFKSSDATLRSVIAGPGGPEGATGPTVTTNVWYLVECRSNVTTGTRTMELTVDGVVYGTASGAIAASTISSFIVGGNVDLATTANFTHFVDDIALSLTDYPIGSGKIVGLFPNADGTHNFSTAGDFMYNNLSAVPTNATDVYTYLDDPLDNIADFIACPAADNTEYIEVQFADIGGTVVSINGVQVTMASHSEDTGPNKHTLRLNDAGTLSDVATDLDQSEQTIIYHSKHYATAPSTGSAWTKTLVNGLKARWNSSYGTVGEVPIPYLDALVLEVDYVPGVSLLPTFRRSSASGDTRTGARNALIFNL